MREYKLSVTELGPSKWLRVDTRGLPTPAMSVMLEFSSEGTAKATLEFSIERDLENATAICHDVLMDIGTNTCSILEGPVAGLRINVLSNPNSDTITLKGLQS